MDPECGNKKLHMFDLMKFHISVTTSCYSISTAIQGYCELLWITFEKVMEKIVEGVLLISTPGHTTSIFVQTNMDSHMPMWQDWHGCQYL